MSNEFSSGNNRVRFDKIVHINDDESIGGIKTFVGYTRDNDANTTGGFVIRNPNIIRGTKSSANQYVCIPFCDASTPEWIDGGMFGRLGMIETCVGTTGDIETYIAAYKYEMGNSSSATLAIGYPLSGNSYVKTNKNNTTLLGTSGCRWKEIWCNQSSLNSSSDERLKSEIEAIPDEILDAWNDIQYTQFHFKNSVEEKSIENSRLHTGLIAQRVSEKLLAKGLDPEKYGFYLYDQWDAEEEEKDKDGNVIKESSPAGDSYGLRYTEALCIEAAYQRRRADRLESRVQQLEEKLTAIEAKLG